MRTLDSAMPVLSLSKWLHQGSLEIQSYIAYTVLVVTKLWLCISPQIESIKATHAEVAFLFFEHQARHNLNYWQLGDSLGIGADAHPSPLAQLLAQAFDGARLAANLKEGAFVV